MTTHEVILPLFTQKPAKRYRTLVADPPWRYEEHMGDGPKGPGAVYGTMSKAELLAMPVGLWAEDDAHLYLWTTNSFIEDAFKLARTWGFAPRTILTWIKGKGSIEEPQQQIGLGYHFRNTTEHVVFAVRGKLPTRRNDIPTAFVAPRRAHSEKPAAFYDMVARQSPGPYLDVFARTQRFMLGDETVVMDTWGNECFIPDGLPTPEDVAGGAL